MPQYNSYYEQVRKIVALKDMKSMAAQNNALGLAAKKKPRILVCAPSNAAIDNVILKIMDDGFVDGNGCRYNPSMVRVGTGQGEAVRDISLQAKIDAVVKEGKDLSKLQTSMAALKSELSKTREMIISLRHRIRAIANAAPYPLSNNWEIRIDGDFDRSGRVFFVNHKEKTTQFEVPEPPEPEEQHYPATAMPEYRTYMTSIVEQVERFYSVSSKLVRSQLVADIMEFQSGAGRKNQALSNIKQQIESHILDTTHIVLTTLGTSGARAFESADKFEVVVIDEAAQSVEPATLMALHLGSKHAILVGDPQQLPATIFSVSGCDSKYGRSLFQRLEESGYPTHLLKLQYRMHPAISDFPRRIFYGGALKDGSNVKHPDYGSPLSNVVVLKFPAFKAFTILDLDSTEERGSTSVSNYVEAQLALHLYNSLDSATGGLSSKSRVAIISPYSQQVSLLKKIFRQNLGQEFNNKVEINTVDGFQGREGNIVIFSCVRASGSKGIGFLSDVRRMNVALTRAKHFLFVIARCASIVANPYWRDLVKHARENRAVLPVRCRPGANGFPSLTTLRSLPPIDNKVRAVAGKTSN